MNDSACIQEWEQELNKTFSSEQRQRIYKRAHETSICARIQETNYKIFARWYRTPERLNQIFSEVSDKCWRCQGSKGTMLHIFWECPMLRSFWREIRRALQICLEYEIPDDPEFYLLHMNQISEKAYRETSICHPLDAAKACITKMWKSPLAPTIEMWICKVKEISKLEELVWTAQHKQEKHLRRWISWKSFLDSRVEV